MKLAYTLRVGGGEVTIKKYERTANAGKVALRLQRDGFLSEAVALTLSPEEVFELGTALLDLADSPRVPVAAPATPPIEGAE